MRYGAAWMAGSSPAMTEWACRVDGTLVIPAEAGIHAVGHAAALKNNALRRRVDGRVEPGHDGMDGMDGMDVADRAGVADGLAARA